jgi:uncharacterized protein YndB with AHSA1/START domain
LPELHVVAEPGVPQIVMTRQLAAPRDLVFRAYTDPELLAQWLGPRGYTMTVDQLELRHGGTWRYRNHGADGAEYAFRGVFHGTPSPDGFVQTFEYEGWPGRVQLDTLTFEEHAEGTLVRVNSVFQSVASRDAMLEAGMAAGFEEGMDRLDELLVRLGREG